jgi:intracellular septation protein A
MAESKAPASSPPSVTDLDELGWVGHGIPAALGIAALIASFFAYQSHIQITLTISLIITGAMLPLLSWLSINRSRAAWSFLISLSVVLGIMTLFGAPKIRTLIGIHMAVALVIPGLFALATVALAAQGHRYSKT